MHIYDPKVNKIKFSVRVNMLDTARYIRELCTLIYSLKSCPAKCNSAGNVDCRDIDTLFPSTVFYSCISYLLINEKLNYSKYKSIHNPSRHITE
jgi:hypothetical protein